MPETKRKWPVELFPAGEVEYKREKPAAGNWSSYMVSTTDGLLIGRVWSRVVDRKLKWYASGWTPRTDDKVFGPFKTRWESFQCLYKIEQGGELPASASEGNEA